MRNKLLKFLLIFLPLIFALVLMLRYVNLPYVGPNATDLNVFSLIARNYNNWGYLNIKFAPIVTLSKAIPKNPAMYLHHPFFMTFVESLFFKVFGYAFWVGRVSVILPAFLILPLFFLIGKEIKNKKFGVITLLVGSLIPATIVFGRMLHYAGAWTLFFVVATAYFSLKYIKVNKKIFLFLAIICVILGTLSDWPVTYFTPFLIPLMFKNKKRIEGILLVATSTITAALFLLYSYFMLGSFTNISDAILNRSVGPLLVSLPFWPVHWLIVILIRFVLYFDPLILLFCGIYIYYFVSGRFVWTSILDLSFSAIYYFFCLKNNRENA